MNEDGSNPVLDEAARRIVLLQHENSELATQVKDLSRQLRRCGLVKPEREALDVIVEWLGSEKNAMKALACIVTAEPVEAHLWRVRATSRPGHYMTDTDRGMCGCDGFDKGNCPHIGWMQLREKLAVGPTPSDYDYE